MRHTAHVAHHSPGRLRIRVPSAKGNPAALEAIRASLASVTGVKDVQVNETIGSLTVNYDPRHGDFEKRLAGESSQQDVVSVECIPKLEELSEIDGMIVHEAEFLSQHSDFAKTIFGFLNALDRGVRFATNNAIDFKVIAPLALAVGAFMELGIEASTPVWLTLGLFSFNHFIDLHTHSTIHSPAAPGANPQVQVTERRDP
jgi:hypothetical protein